MARGGVEDFLQKLRYTRMCKVCTYLSGSWATSSLRLPSLGSSRAMPERTYATQCLLPAVLTIKRPAPVG